MIKIILTIEEEKPGVIRFTGAGGSKNYPTPLEVRFATKVMIAVDNVERDSETVKKVDVTPLTVIEHHDKKPSKKSKHANRN